MEINKTVIVASRWFLFYLTYIDDARSNTNQNHFCVSEVITQHKSGGSDNGNGLVAVRWVRWLLSVATIWSFTDEKTVFTVWWLCVAVERRHNLVP